jgi:hypothetical protein
MMALGTMGLSAEDPDRGECPASPAERQAHAADVLPRGARPWSMAPLPATVPAAPVVRLPPLSSEERRHWIRRNTFVLSGLPPRDDDTAAFLVDASPRAWEKVLDRLLAASTAPQRMAEVWLRATGYADRWPAEIESGTPMVGEAWRYRDWVVTALRTTPDVRKLARLTLAGDAGDARSGAPAAGQPTSGAVATLWHVTDTPPSADFEELVVTWAGRQAERTARTFLGVDLTCARCHDHPALPLPSDEAAGLVAIFAHSHAFVRGSDGAPALHRVSTTTAQTRQKRERALAQVAAAEAAVEEKRREFALVAAAEFLPQTAEYVRAAWARHRSPDGSLAAFAAKRGLLEAPLERWMTTLGLGGEAPTHALSAPWWAAWTEARNTGTAEAIAAAARQIQESHRADADSPFFTTCPVMDAFFTLDQQKQLARLTTTLTTRRRAVPEESSIASLAEGPAPGMDPPALTPSLPTLLTGGAAPTPIQPPGAGRRALATWLEGEGAHFFARLGAVRLAEGLGYPLLPAPSGLQLWAATRPPTANVVDEVAACLQAGGWPAAAKRILILQAREPERSPLAIGGSEWRDAVLFVAGTLDPRQGGPADAAPDSPRRSLYREWAPLPAAPTREFLEAQADALAALARRRAGPDPAVQLNFLTHQLFQRSPTAAERGALSQRPADLPSFCASLLQSEEFRVFP